MAIILLHSSKTMRQPKGDTHAYQMPQLIKRSLELAHYLHTVSSKQLASSMNLSSGMAAKTRELLADWTEDSAKQQPAIDTFLGDIYSGLQTHTFSESDRKYANTHLYILSGLYGVLRALDSVYPYRLEMGYKLPDARYANLYKFWGDSIAKLIPADQPIVDLSSIEYSKVVLPYLASRTIVRPKFMTRDPKSGEAKFVTVHAKVARGAFARWMIVNRVEDLNKLTEFTDLNYKFDASLSTPDRPIFVCDEFGGIGLSVRLT